MSVATGDVSGDRHDDLVIGSLLADPFDQANAGAVYVMFGGAGAGGRVDFLNSSLDVVIAGNSTAFDSDRLGTDVVVGDFNGDGRGDIAAAAVLRQTFTGGVFLWFGPFAKGRVINLRSTKPDRTIVGAPSGATSARRCSPPTSTATGAPICWSGLGAGARRRSGGRRRGPRLPRPDPAGGRQDLTPSDADISIVGPAGSTLSGALSLGQCSCHGQPIVFDDVTGDGAPDLILGAPLDDGRKGRVYVLPGLIAGRRIDIAQAPHLTLTSALPEGKLGWSIATGALTATVARTWW
ncbi:MAG: FG-GAP repeat protein [Anaerolineae bacterium]